MVEMVQKSLFSGTFMEMLDTNDPLIVLAYNYPWSKLENNLLQKTHQTCH